ncbi:MAG: DUF1569 domain-containing protein [Mucilaginibacter sp.]
MKTVYDKVTRDALIERINALSENSKAQWGKMNLYQMLRHSTLWIEWLLVEERHKQQFIGRLFGKVALKGLMKDDGPLRRNTPTLPELRIKETSGDIAAEKKKWIMLLEELAHFRNPDFVHTFFGKMTKEEVGYMAYKHIDHHLRQFNG